MLKIDNSIKHKINERSKMAKKQYHVDNHAEFIKCDKLVELARDFEEARKDAEGHFGMNLSSLSLWHKWNVNSCVLDQMLLFKQDIEDKFWDDAQEVLALLRKEFPEEELSDLEKAKRVIQFLEKIDELGVTEPEYDANYMIWRIKKEFSINEP